MSVDRRDFLMGAGALMTGAASSAASAQPKERSARSSGAADRRSTKPARRYDGAQLSNIKFPLGGIGAGMICIEGSGALSSISIRDRPDLLNEPMIFSAVSARGVTRVLEGPVPSHKILHQPLSSEGGAGTTYGLPRFKQASFCAQFPFAEVELSDEEIPISAKILAWSPFEPLEEDLSSLPFAALEYELKNTSLTPLTGLFSFHARNFLGSSEIITDTTTNGEIRRLGTGFVMSAEEAPKPDGRSGGALAIEVDAEHSSVSGWYKGHAIFDCLRQAWRSAQGIRSARYQLGNDAPPGASLFVNFDLLPGETRTITIRLAWRSLETKLRAGHDPAVPTEDKTFDGGESYRPWYKARFSTLDQSSEWWRAHYDDLKFRAIRFRDCFFSTTLPAEVVDAVAANLSIFKSPTILRQSDGRLWGWEGVDEASGNGSGSCTHVWNYAQAMPHLFPALERTMRETELGVMLDAEGRQIPRVPLPIARPAVPSERLDLLTPDGQLGSIVRTFRDWRISGDTQWLRRLWPRLRASMAFCMKTWDPGGEGWLSRPRGNTYDLMFWEPDIRDSGIYVVALSAMVQFAEALGHSPHPYASVLARGIAKLDGRLFNGEYYQQRDWSDRDFSRKDLDALKKTALTEDEREIMNREGALYQYATGCMTDGLVGEWLAQVCSLGSLLDPTKVKSHLSAVFRHNYRKSLSDHANPQRPKYALGAEGGTILCTWPRGAEPTVPFIYSNEVWTGIEYEAASHLIMVGLVDEGLEVLRACRARHDGSVRNPFDDFEAGRWYARSMACYALLQALSGARLDAVTGVLHLWPAIKGDFQSFLCTASGYGLVGVSNGEPFINVVAGEFRHSSLDYRAA
jgi:hypothetical protein